MKWDNSLRRENNFNVCMHNNRASDYVRERLIELPREMDESNIIKTSKPLHQEWIDPIGRKSAKT